MALVRNEILSKLVCSTCSKYLSHFPVYFEPNLGAICGRCQPSATAVRNHLYESALEFSKFPCCFHANGCIERLVPRQIPDHEKWCTHRTIQCIAVQDSNCEWKGLAKGLYDHFEKKHMEFILLTRSFEIDFVNSHNENCLLSFGQDLYVVTRAADSKKNVYCCTVTYIGSNPRCAEYFFKLTFKNVNGSTEHVMQRKMGQTVEVKRKEIRDLLADPLSIVVEIDVLEEEEEDEKMDADSKEHSTINYEMLKELECLVSICFVRLYSLKNRNRSAPIPSSSSRVLSGEIHIASSQVDR